MRLSNRTLDYLRTLINEGSVYRSGPQLIRFFSDLRNGPAESYGPDFGSRKEYTRARLEELNGGDGIAACIRKVLDVRDYADDLAGRDAVIQKLNRLMAADGWVVVREGGDGLTFRVATEADRKEWTISPESHSPECYDEVFVEKDEEDFGPINKPFDPNLIDISTQPQAISNIVSLIKHDEIDLHPAFQRSGNIWDERKQSRLIESLLLRIPLPAFYFDAEEQVDNLGVRHNRWQVIDGLQRLCAINNFMVETSESEYKLKLSGLEFLDKLNGKTFEELPYQYQRIINETQITAYLIKKGTPTNVKFNIFKRVNTGGVPLTQQEIRHALHQGVASAYLQELAESESFRSATSKRIPSERMLDREFVNRFLAFYCLDRKAFGDLESFLDSVLEDIEHTDITERTRIRETFYDSLNVIHGLFGRYAFCKLDAYPRVKPINKVLFEVLTVSVAKLSDGERNVLRTLNASTALEKYVSLFRDESYEGLSSLISTSTGMFTRISRRYDLMHRFLVGLLAESPDAHVSEK